MRGNNVLATGGTNGLGKAVSCRLAKAGADVVIPDIDGIAAVSVAEDIAAKPDDIAEVILSLLSDANRCLVDETVVADGGTVIP